VTALLADVDLHHPLMRAAEVGASFVADALTDAMRKILHAEIGAGSFEPLPAQIGAYGVRQEAELLQIDPDRVTSYPAVAQLRLDLAGLVHAHGHGIPGLAAWQPNDIAAMRYHAGSLGVTPHRDSKRYRQLIAIFTVAGSATFTHCADREGTVVNRWQTTPGSLVLLRAPGPAGAGETRPFHTISGPTNGPRVSLTFRMREQTP
jgi:hypothetical protein